VSSVVNFTNILRAAAKKLHKLFVVVEKLRSILYFKKAARKKLVKLTPVVNFINILRAYICTFVLSPKPKSNKRKVVQSSFIKKAARQMLVKLTPVVNFINILGAHICTCVLSPKPKSKKRKAMQSSFVKKAARKMLVKLTPGEQRLTMTLFHSSSVSLFPTKYVWLISPSFSMLALSLILPIVIWNIS
jgi:hypothetical protein